MEGRWLVQLDTGSGKTALCFAVACFYARKGFKVLILNVSEELTFRDYKKALPTAKETEILVNFMEKVEEETLIQDGITFISFKAVS
jgi:superfamily II DNA or RNA helicase